MFHTLLADRDTYVTDKIVSGRRCVDSNVGAGGSLDLFKLYGESFSGTVPNVELSRLLVHFDLSPLRRLIAAQKIDPGAPSFFCTLQLSDVYGGQPTPIEFDVDVHPLSASFDEGLGRDVAFYADSDVCNFMTASRSGGAWHVSGAGLGGAATGSVDYITSASLNSGPLMPVWTTQRFVDGTEDLRVDITTVMSATLSGLLPDRGFRIALGPTHENDDRTYFVKRFASRSAYDPTKRPKIVVGYDDSRQDDSAALAFDSSCDIFLRNRVHGHLADIVSASLHVTGAGCLRLKMMTEVSGGWYTSTFSGSQFMNGVFPVTGVYTGSIFLDSSDPVYRSKIAASGSVFFRPVWESLDGTVAYVTGSDLTVSPPDRSSFGPGARRFIVTVTGIGQELFSTRVAVCRVNIFDAEQVGSRRVKAPTVVPGLVMRDVHVQVRDSVTGLIVVPFDTIRNSSRTSSDPLGHYFELDGSTLPVGRSYVIDVMLACDENPAVYHAASQEFRVTNAQ